MVPLSTDRIADKLLRLFHVTPADKLYPFAGFKILIVLKKVLDLCPLLSGGIRGLRLAQMRASAGRKISRMTGPFRAKKNPFEGALTDVGGERLAEGKMHAALVQSEPLSGQRFHFLSEAERHALQRFATQLIWIGYAVGGESDECLAKLDSQFLPLRIVRRNVRIERPPNGVERLLHGVER